MAKRVWQLIREGIGAFVRDEALTRGAAIAFYTVTAIAPILYLAVTIAGLAFGRAAARGAIASALAHLMSRDSADLLELAIRDARGTPNGIRDTLLGLLTLLITASGVFGEMEDALNAIWNAPRQGAVLPRLLRGRAISLVLVIGLGFVLLASMGASAAIASLGRYITLHAVFSQFWFSLLNLAISFVLMSLLFAAIYKIVPKKQLEWSDVSVGAIVTALLFLLGQYLLSYYLSGTHIARPYGVAGGLIVLLVWTYYSAQVFLLGAEFTKVYTLHYGSQRSAGSGDRVLEQQ